MATNEITGDRLVSKVTNDAYRGNYDKIFKKSYVAEENKNIKEAVQLELDFGENNMAYLPEQPCDKEDDPNWGVGWGYKGK